MTASGQGEKVLVVEAAHLRGDVVLASASFDGSVLPSTCPSVTLAFAAADGGVADGGRDAVADTGVDPVPMMRECKKILASRPKAELLWASSREVLNIFQAD